MGFNSLIFIFLFLPVLLACYFCFNKKIKVQNFILFIFSIGFYAWGNIANTLILLFSIVLNYFLGKWIFKVKQEDKVKGNRIKTIGVVLNLLLLFAFKYVPFTVESINGVFGCNIPIPNIPLPVGISYFTFQAISYLIDIKRGRVEAQRNIIDLGVYLSFFVRVSAGPIVKYQNFVKQLSERQITLESFASGIGEFVIGLAKKVVLAGSLTVLTNDAFNMNSDTLSVGLAWLGMFAASFYIYFDFSGYSDMARGIGKMLGFDIPKNFNYPYIATSIAEYWRRWHMTMSEWFKDYVFLPVTIGKTFKKNPFTKKALSVGAKMTIATGITWLCTGIWHGAQWSYVLWGIYYFILMTIEPHFHKFKNQKVNIVLGFIFTQLAVRFGQVLVRSTNVVEAGKYFGNMLFMNSNIPIFNADFWSALNDNWMMLLISTIASLPVAKYLTDKLKVNSTIKEWAYYLWIVALFAISIVFLIQNGYQPAVYTRF